MIREAAKKGYFFSGPANKREGGGKGLATKKKQLFSKLEKKNPVFFFVAIKLELP